MNKLARQTTTPALYKVRAVNPSVTKTSAKTSSPPGRRPSLKKLLGQGSQVLDRLAKKDPHYGQDGRQCWELMEVAWNSASRADRKTALTCLQIKLQQWTAEDAEVAADGGIQKFRKTLHLALDH